MMKICDKLLISKVFSKSEENERWAEEKEKDNNMEGEEEVWIQEKEKEVGKQ